MNYLGVYHSDYPRSTVGICDAPCISKGRMMLSAQGILSEGAYLAMARGRITNRHELIALLQCASNISDARLVLLSYQKWGDNYPTKIEGPVMTCLLDTKEDHIVLSRDRMGEQPIFYVHNGDGRVVFSDHPDSLLKTASAEPIVDQRGLSELFGLGPARTPGYTPLRDIRSLESGCALIGEKGLIHIERYYRIPMWEHTENESETIAHTRYLLEKAVDDIAPLHPGAMLSGGLDSTALTAMLCRRYAPVKTFSVDYRDNDEDFKANSFRPSKDAPFVEMAVKAFETEHHNFVLEQALLADALENAVSARGLPGMADIDSSLYLFAKKISEFVPVVVSGECGDEVFGGYPWFRGDAKLSKDVFPWSGSIELRESILRSDVRKKLNLRQYVHNTVVNALEQTQIDGSEDDREVRLRKMQLLCYAFFMPNLQERAIRMCGCHELEVLTPLCDHRLVEYVFNVPWSMKFMNGMEKGLFRAAVRDWMPQTLNERKKSPYPKTCSPIYAEIIRGMTSAMLADREAPILEWVDAEKVRALMNSSLDPADTPWFGQLMAGPQMLAYLWQINHWMRERNITVRL